MPSLESPRGICHTIIQYDFPPDFFCKICLSAAATVLVQVSSIILYASYFFFFFSFLLFPASRYVHLLRVLRLRSSHTFFSSSLSYYFLHPGMFIFSVFLRLRSSHLLRTLSKYVFYITCSFCLCHLYPTSCRNYFVFLFV